VLQTIVSLSLKKTKIRRHIDIDSNRIASKPVILFEGKKKWNFIIPFFCFLSVTMINGTLQHRLTFTKGKERKKGNKRKWKPDYYLMIVFLVSYFSRFFSFFFCYLSMAETVENRVN